MDFCAWNSQVHLSTLHFHRYTTTKGWGPVIDARIAWFVMESPNLWMPLVVKFVLAPVYTPRVEAEMTLPNYLLLFMFLSHYVNRTIVYPLRMSSECSNMPISVVFLAFAYCCWNGFNQSVSLCVVMTYPDTWTTDLRFLVGVFIFFTGMFLNIQSDNTLLTIRKNIKDIAKIQSTEKRYEIPRGGLFEFVSCANYGAEIFEWCGFAIACWSLPAAAFAFYTFCNIGPRGYKHHLWYKKYFKDYPKSRKAVIPFVW